MRALSIRQPWAWLIVQGYKDIENRFWLTNYRGEFLIHAGKKLDLSLEPIRYAMKLGIYLPRNVFAGGIVGIAEITDCVASHSSEWFTGPYGFVIKNAKPLEFYPLKGQLGFFETGVEIENII